MEWNDMKHVRAVRVNVGGERALDWRRNGDEAELHPVGCIFKAVVAALIGASIWEGRIGSTDDRVIDYFGDAETPAEWEELTIAHALSKTTGLIWPGPEEKMPQDMQEAMKMPFSHAPGEAFFYKPDPQIAVYLLEKVYGKPICELFCEKIGRRLGQDAYRWDRENIEGMQLSMDALEALGKMFLKRGILDGARLFDEEYVDEMMKPRSDGGFPERLPYGLGIWIGECRGMNYFLASGFGGQMLAIIPQKELIICVLSDMDRPHPENRQIIEQICVETAVR